MSPRTRHPFPQHIDKHIDNHIDKVDIIDTTEEKKTWP